MILKSLRTLTIALAAATAFVGCAQTDGEVASTQSQGAAIGEVVRTPMGSVRGAEAAPGVMVYKGMPFAAAPVGALRFREAQAPQPWSGVLDGTKWGNTCIQPPAPTRPIGVNQATDMPDSPPISEDCLNLNVWTPADYAGEKLPVMIWFYGGAYNEGGGSMPFADGTNLARKGVIVVSMNYRVGPYGFLSYPGLTEASPHDASGNQALSDAIASLKWVQQNIAAFGGDPNNVTIFGQSAGACITAALTGSPVAAGLFNRSISESGAWAGLTAAKMQTRETMEARSVTALEAAGIHNLAELQVAPPEKLATIRNQGIIIDGWIVPEDLSKTFAEGRQNKVDVLLGSNANEGGSFGGFGGGPAMTAENWRNTAPQRWRDLAELGLAAYPVQSDAEAVVAATRPFTDGIAWFMHLYADQQAKAGKAAYLYQFARTPASGPGKINGGPSHAAELAYVFGTLDKPREVPDNSDPAVVSQSAPDIALADQIMTYWTNFARTGNPNGPGLPMWPQVTQLQRHQAMLLDVNSRVGETMTPAQVALYDALFQRDIAGPLGIANWK
jgi:para-nitrobenzyl esterase